MRYLFILALLLTTVCGAEEVRRRGGRHPFDNYERLYDPRTTESVTGEVVGIEHFSPSSKWGYTKHVILLKEKDEYDLIYLGPTWHLAKKGFPVKKGDQLKVSGSRVTVRGQPMIIAKDADIDDRHIELRDDYGNPYWRGQKRRGY